MTIQEHQLGERAAQVAHAPGRDIDARGMVSVDGPDLLQKTTWVKKCSNCRDLDTASMDLLPVTVEQEVRLVTAALGSTHIAPSLAQVEFQATLASLRNIRRNVLYSAGLSDESEVTE
jgi:hypothetical protein